VNSFDYIKEALTYIDEHLEEEMTVETIAERFHFSAFYFHRMFSVIVGKPLAAHIRDRRLQQACIHLAASDKAILAIGMDCGYHSAQSFSRAFKTIVGVYPSEYRKQGYVPVVVPVEEMIMKFTNRLRGGILLNPRIIKQEALYIAGVSGDGDKTWDVWNAFEKLSTEKPLQNRLSGNGYEIRLSCGGSGTVHVGNAVSDDNVDPDYAVYKLPRSIYAVFDVYVANGYESENNAMNEWLKTNKEGYTERLLGDTQYCVEFYDERFNGSEAGSIVEIWIPVEKK
jgi:AraC-like DNA-binding protein/predicted transcriptional regulator YdeE